MIKDASKLAFLWFTFGPDAECLIESVCSAFKAAPGARFYVAEDVNDPLPAWTVQRLREGDVEILSTPWDRKGNLNGLDHLRGQIRLMREIMPHGGTVVKIDSDVILQDARWLAQHDWEARPVVAVTQPAWWFQGGTYGASLPALETALALLPQAESICPHQGPRWPEDQVFGELIAYARPAAIGHYHGWPVGPAVAHYDYAGNAPFSAYRQFWTVNFGGRANIKAPAALRRGLAAETMRAFRAYAARVTG